MTIQLNEDGQRIYPQECRECAGEGAGEVEYAENSASVDPSYRVETCDHCEGTGRYDYTESDIDCVVNRDTSNEIDFRVLKLRMLAND